jgi:hypothetical protein
MRPGRRRDRPIVHLVEKEDLRRAAPGARAIDAHPQPGGGLRRVHLHRHAVSDPPAGERRCGKLLHQVGGASSGTRIAGQHHALAAAPAFCVRQQGGTDALRARDRPAGGNAADRSILEVQIHRSRRRLGGDAGCHTRGHEEGKAQPSGCRADSS